MSEKSNVVEMKAPALGELERENQELKQQIEAMKEGHQEELSALTANHNRLDNELLKANASTKGLCATVDDLANQNREAVAHIRKLEDTVRAQLFELQYRGERLQELEKQVTDLRAHIEKNEVEKRIIDNATKGVMPPGDKKKR